MIKVKREVKIAITFIVGIAILIWGLNFLKGKALFNDTQTFYAVYDKVDGLVPSNLVVINGLKVGKVEEINFMPDNSGRIIVKFTVVDDFKIPYDTEARIFSADLMGSKSLDLVLGKSSVQAKEGDTLQSSVQESLKEEVNRQILPIKNKAEELLSSIENMVTAINAVVNDSIKGINSTIIENLKGTARNINQLTSPEGALNKTLVNVESITANIDNNKVKLNKAINNFSSISDSLAKVKYAVVLKNANKTIEETNKILEKINQGQGSMGQLVNNDSLYRGLEKSSKELGALLEDMKLHPQRYVHFSLFGTKASKAPYKK